MFAEVFLPLLLFSTGLADNCGIQSDGR